MILDAQLIMILVGFILFILAYEKKAIVLFGVSIVMFISSLASTLYIEIPYSTWNTTSAMVETGTAGYQDYGLQALCLGMIFINLIYMIYLTITSYIDEKERQEKRKRYHM